MTWGDGHSCFIKLSSSIEPYGILHVVLYNEATTLEEIARIALGNSTLFSYKSLFFK